MVQILLMVFFNIPKKRKKKEARISSLFLTPVYETGLQKLGGRFRGSIPLGSTKRKETKGNEREGKKMKSFDQIVAEFINTDKNRLKLLSAKIYVPFAAIQLWARSKNLPVEKLQKIIIKVIETWKGKSS